MMETNTLAVPGATLHYEVRGAGPVLLLICGGVYDAAAFAPLAEALADRYTVVTYDRRGNSRSPLDGPPGPQRIEEHADDAYRMLLLAAGGSGAYVFGNSSGAIIGLDLAARHPEVVRVLVAHEPPLFELLPERDHWRGVIRDVEAAYREGGPAAAGQVLGAALGMSGGQDGERAPGGGEFDAATAAMLARFAANNEFFLEFEVPPFSRYAPDLDALEAAGTRIVPAVGVASGGEPPARAAHALGWPVATFPGDHGGFGLHVEAFARRLDEVMRAA